MLLVLVSLSFVCAVTPMLSPYDTVTVQSLVTGALVVYIIVLGVIMG
jgi:energy-converting hydrogenase A subunit J